MCRIYFPRSLNAGGSCENREADASVNSIGADRLFPRYIYIRCLLCMKMIEKSRKFERIV